MSWPIGYGLPNVTYRGDTAGTVYANSQPVTDAGGWLDLPAPRLSSAHGTSQEISIRLRVSVDGDGVPFIYAEEVEIGGRRFAGLHSLVAREGEAWLNYLIAAIDAQMARRLWSATEYAPSTRAHSNAQIAGATAGDEISRRVTPFAGNRSVAPANEPRSSSGTRMRTPPATEQPLTQPIPAYTLKRR